MKPMVTRIPHTPLNSMDLWLQKIVVGILSTFTSLLLPIYLCQFAIIAICRQLAILSKPKDFQEPLAIQSAMMANMDDIYGNTTFSIVAPLFMQGKPDLNKIRMTIRDKLLRKKGPTGNLFYPELLQGVGYWMGYPFWRYLTPEKNRTAIEDLFLQECIKLYDDDYGENGTSTCDLKKLQEITKYLCFKPYQENRPLIEFILIPNFIPDPVFSANFSITEEHFVIILRLNHLLADGYSILRLLECLSINTPADRLDYLKVYDYTTKHTSSKGSLLMQAINHAKYFMQASYQVTDYLFQGNLFTAPGTLWDPDQLDKSHLTAIKSEAELNPYEIAKIRSNRIKAAWSKPFSLQEINAIKSRFGVSGTAVMYSAIVGAIRNTMFSEDKLRQQLLPSRIGFALPLPLPREDGRLLNHSAFMTLFLLLREPDPVKRLLQVNDSIQDMKASTLPVVATLLTTGVLGLTPRWFAQFVDREAKKKEAILVSNVPGPKQNIDLAGYLITDCMWCTGQIIESNYIFVNLISCMGLVRLAVMGRQGLLKSDENAQRFVDNFFQELELLKTIQKDGEMKKKHL